MHMSDALLSPAVGGVMWGASVAALAVSSRTVAKDPDTSRVPLMGALGAFVFAAQMINFTIPGTGSSGHLAGAMLLSILLGPHAAFLVLSSVLIVQALFFADGGILALGANMFNIGFYACFLAYPLIYRPIAGPNPGRPRLFAAAVAASVASLAAGSFSVALQTVASGISSLPLAPFTAAMVPIHLAIGVVEGVVTGIVVVAVRSIEPNLLGGPAAADESRRRLRIVVVGVIVAAIVTGGVLSWIASTHPDGLEWSIANVAGDSEPEPGSGGLLTASSWLQEKLSFLPDYGLPNRDAGNPATTLSGVVGGFLTLALIMVAGLLVKKRKRRAAGPDDSNGGN